MAGDEAAAEPLIAALVAEAVARFGVAGEVKVRGGFISLQGAGPTAERELGSLARQWDGLHPEEQRRRALELARQLVSQRRSSLPASSVKAPAKTVWTLPHWALPAGVACALLGGFVVYGRFYRAQQPFPQGSAAPSAAHTADAYERERQLRLQHTCSETEARVMRGATVGPVDVDGWVVELTLLRPAALGPLSADPQLAKFVRLGKDSRTGQLVWSEALELSQLSSPATRVEIADQVHPERGEPELRGLTIGFFGQFVGAYFDETQRPRFMQVASAVSEHLGATHAGLYARCEHSQSHQLGSWFRGNTPSDAAAVLVLLMGVYAAVPQLPTPLLVGEAPDSGLDRARTLAIIRDRTKTLDRAQIARILSDHGGLIAGARGGPTTLSFEFKDGNRAARSSLALVRAIGLANAQAR